jgi:nucleoside-diphosphate-sugar epimerase
VVGSLRTAFAGRCVCVTGGAGFIGGHVCDALLSVGARISVIDDLSSSDAGHVSELVDLEPERVRFVHGSILDDSALDEAMSSVKVVLHLAAMGSVPRSIEQPERYFAVNATGTLRVLEAARRHGAERVVLASSSSVYGDAPMLPKREGVAHSCLSPYAASKLAGEGLVSAYARSLGVDGVSLRYFNVFGPRQRADSDYAAVIAAFAQRLLSGRSPIIFGDGSATRDFTYVGNAVLATLLAGSREEALEGRVINVGTGRQTSIRDLAALMAVRCKKGELSAEHRPERAGDVKHSLADITLARQVLGYEPFESLETGLDQTLAWYRASGLGAAAASPEPGERGAAG